MSAHAHVIPGWCVTCHHGKGMHHDVPPKTCAYPYCSCKNWRPEPRMQDFTPREKKMRR